MYTISVLSSVWIDQNFRYETLRLLTTLTITLVAMNDLSPLHHRTSVLFLIRPTLPTYLLILLVTVCVVNPKVTSAGIPPRSSRADPVRGTSEYSQNTSSCLLTTLGVKYRYF